MLLLLQHAYLIVEPEYEGVCCVCFHLQVLAMYLLIVVLRNIITLNTFFSPPNRVSKDIIFRPGLV